ncbi:WhiB family transcriptional regulator [Micromonospora taraxaci]|uniref:WhiB family transcriptional regulator n=1 Tax=Micromonospora taraxaci TaxID=1316803 RepID=UPI003C2ADB05
MRNDEELKVADLTGSVGDWQERALCREVDGEVFYPEKGGTVDPAKRICRNCEVKTECLEYALGRNEEFGVWGGYSERERRAMKRKGSKQVAA